MYQQQSGRSTVTDTSRKAIIPLHLALSPHLEYCSRFWVTQYKKEKNLSPEKSHQDVYGVGAYDLYEEKLRVLYPGEKKDWGRGYKDGARLFIEDA